MPMQRDHFWDLPLYFDAGITPIAISVPPYHFWEPPPETGHLPMHGSDFGLFQLAEVLGMKQVIYVKDEDGLYDKDPKRHTDAVRFGKITLGELLPQLPAETILDAEVFHAWSQAKNLQRITIVNGLVPGQLTRAMRGEDVGTVIVKEPAP
jgi:molybdenum storage protein